MPNDKWKKRRLSWDEKHMLNALVDAARSSCIYLHTGAVVVKNKRIIAEGYNGAPEGVENCLDAGCRKAEHGIDFETKGTGNCRGVHDVMNALGEIAKKDAHHSILYTVYYPCSVCAKIIANSGVKGVVYLKIYKEPASLTKEIFEERGIKVRKLELDIEKCLSVIKEVYEE
jgi:dCMP deaminase